MEISIQMERSLFESWIGVEYSISCFSVVLVSVRALDAEVTLFGR